MVFVGIMVSSSISHAMGGVQGGAFGDMPRQAQDEMLKAISMGLGIYLSVLASLYFAGVALKQYLLTKAIEEPVIQHKAAA
jgi:hypothetical protein